jgi:hypothetical protein
MPGGFLPMTKNRTWMSGPHFGWAIRWALSIILISIGLLGAANPSYAQAKSFSVRLSVVDNRIRVVVDLKGISEAFFKRKVAGSECENYTLFETTAEKDSIQRRLDWFDKAFRIDDKTAIACKLNPGNIKNRIEFQLESGAQLHEGSTYRLVRSDPRHPSSQIVGELIFHHSMVTGNPLQARTEIKIQPATCFGEINSIAPNNVVVRESSETIRDRNHLGPATFRVDKVRPNPDGLVLVLGDALPEGSPEHLKITFSEITAGPNYCGEKSITVKGVINTSHAKVQRGAKELSDLQEHAVDASSSIYPAIANLMAAHVRSDEFNRSLVSPFGDVNPPSAAESRSFIGGTMDEPESRLHAMLVDWLRADATLAYLSDTTLASLWTIWQHRALYDKQAIDQLMTAIKKFYGDCLRAKGITVEYGEFTPGGDLQDVGSLAIRLSPCE